jgi:hypothetical protein
LKADSLPPEKPTGRLALLRNIVWDLRWTVAGAVAPRLCLIGFKFAQPFLINDLINHVSENGSNELSGVKYGFVGATVLIYVGIAVSSPYVSFSIKYFNH